MARLTNYLKQMAQEITGRYEPAKHYMRGPGPAWHEKQRSLQQHGGSFPRVVGVNGTAKVAPDTKLKQLSS